MNSENSKTSDPHRLLLSLTDNLNLRRSGKYVALLNLSIYSAWKNIKMPYKNNKFKISAPTWNEEFEVQLQFRDSYRKKFQKQFLQKKNKKLLMN